ncbi:MAG TPA: prolyl oligopeptidase family serine peptidase [Nitrospinota bacterium]|nr:prolyl oligopeptidase family serine peptidase [Nitrospinota bacterium]
MRNKFYFPFVGLLLFIVIVYFCVGFYLAHTILRIDHSCGDHEGSLPNTWSAQKGYQKYKIEAKSKLRKNFDSARYHLDKWEEVFFPSRDDDIQISGWLFNYHPNKPIVIVVHGIFPNGKCKWESNLVASLLINNGINALTIDLRNYGQSSIVSEYENLGLSEYRDVLGAFDFLTKRGFSKDKIGIHGIALGATSAIFAAKEEPSIKAIWSESSLAEFRMILKDEIYRYNFPHDFAPAVSFAGRILTGIDPTKLSPAYSLSNKQNYFFTHGAKDQRVPPHHFYFLKQYASNNHIKANFWLVKDAYHVDAMLMYPTEYGLKMKAFFERHLNVK